MPGGKRLDNGAYYYIGEYGFWGSTREATTTNAWLRLLYTSYIAAIRNSKPKTMGLSVRCIKDSPGGLSPGFTEPSNREAVSAEIQDEILLNPNPANTEVNLEISSTVSGDCRIEIRDMMGRVLLDENRSLQPVANVLSYDLRNFRNGIYQVRVLRGSRRKVYRLVKY